MIPTVKEEPINYGNVQFGTRSTEQAEHSFVQVPGESQFWLLQYRHKGIFKYRIFAMEGTRQEAIERAKQHCSIQGFKMEWCEPMICDLNYEDQKTLKGL